MGTGPGVDFGCFGSGKPGRPAFLIAQHMQQPFIGKIIRCDQTTGDLRQTYRLQHFPTQLFRLEPGPFPQTVADVQVIAFRFEIGVPDRRDKADRQLWIAVQKRRQPRSDPVHRQADRSADGQHFGAAVAKHLLGSGTQPFERILHLGQIGGTGLGQQQAAGFALEQRFAQVVFQQLDLFGHRRLRQVQFRSSMGKAQMPRRSLEGAHPGQGGQSDSHVAPPDPLWVCFHHSRVFHGGAIPARLQ